MSKPVKVNRNNQPWIYLEDFPVLSPPVQTPIKTDPIITQTVPKPKVEEFPSLVTQPIPNSRPVQQEQKSSFQSKKQSKKNDFPSIVSKQVPIFTLGTKEVWQNKQPPKNQSKKVNLNKTYQVPRTQPQIVVEKKSSQPQRPITSIVQTPIKPTTSQAQELQRNLTVSRVSEKVQQDSSESESENQNEGDVWPNFEKMSSKLKKIQEFKIPLCFPFVKHYLYEKAPNQEYSTHYEKSRVHQFFHQTSQTKKWAKWTKLGKLRVLCINCDFNIPSRNCNNQSSGTQDSDGSDFKRTVKVYYKTSETERARQIVNQIKLAIFEGVDFICLQEICQTVIREELLRLLEELKDSGSSQYFFPKNLESHEYLRTTMILSKYPVKFGHLKFEIAEHENQDESKFYFPLQAFCEFEVMMGKKVLKVGILTCHLRSNGERNSQIRPHKMRKMQVRCIHDFSRRFDKFFCIGDTNIPSSEKFKNQNIWVKRRFVDAFDVGRSDIGGTYMFRTRANVVKEQRMDRVLMKKEMKDNTDVEIKFKEVLLESCKNKRFNKKEMMALEDEKLIYISPSDHEILDINIQFTREE